LEDFPVEEPSAQDPARDDSAANGSPAPADVSATAGPQTGGAAPTRGSRNPRRLDPTVLAVDPVTGEWVDKPAVRAGRAVQVRSRRGSGNRRRNAMLGLGLVMAILVGGTGELVYSALNQGSTSSPGLLANGASSSAPATHRPASPSPTSTAGATSTPRPTGTPGPTPTAAPQASGPALPAVVTFQDLMLDSAADPNGTARTFAFTTDGPGSVSAQVVTAAPLTNLKMCIQVNGGSESCSTGGTPGMFIDAPSSGDQSQWSVTLIATDAGASPVVDVAIRWQTKAPAITLTNGRFQGSPNPDSLRGFTATFKTRAAGSVGLVASWPPATANATLALTDATKSPGSAVDQTTYSSLNAISPAYTHAVAAGRTYQIQVLNASTDAGRPDFSTTITFP
jgi:hypothetical protein